jgi:CheY-like chemotaxis protein
LGAVTAATGIRSPGSLRGDGIRHGARSICATSGTTRSSPRRPVHRLPLIGTPEFSGAGGLMSYWFDVAEQYENALQMLADGIRPDLIAVLSDIKMPGMDGLQIARRDQAAVP